MLDGKLAIFGGIFKDKENIPMLEFHNVPTL
jgi:hypothetical protein